MTTYQQQRRRCAYHVHQSKDDKTMWVTGILMDIPFQYVFELISRKSRGKSFGNLTLKELLFIYNEIHKNRSIKTQTEEIGSALHRDWSAQSLAKMYGYKIIISLMNAYGSDNIDVILMDHNFGINIYKMNVEVVIPKNNDHCYPLMVASFLNYYEFKKREAGVLILEKKNWFGLHRKLQLDIIDKDVHITGNMNGIIQQMENIFEDCHWLECPLLSNKSVLIVQKLNIKNIQKLLTYKGFAVKI